MGETCNIITDSKIQLGPLTKASLFDIGNHTRQRKNLLTSVPNRTHLRVNSLVPLFVFPVLRVPCFPLLGLTPSGLFMGLK